MTRSPKGSLFRFTLSAAVIAAWPAAAWADSSLSPYKMLRSLQFMQDSVVLGDHSAGDMQRFMLATIDNRLRTADAEIFSEPRNADAALVYAMSGGNPATLSYLVARDVDGNFDARVVNVLQKYFDGRGMQVAKTIGDLVPEYRHTALGPYLALIAGNITFPTDAKAALGFFDEARLSAPGTIIEEAALRRSIVASMGVSEVEKALSYSRHYARRFVHSPYSNQFADLFVELVVKHYGVITENDILDVLEPMDTARRQEIYLRIARAATLRGNQELARLSATEAQRLAGLLDGNGQPVLPNLYESVASVSSSDVVSAIDRLSSVSDEALSERDRALRNAARSIAEQILQPPVLDEPVKVEEPRAGATGQAFVAPRPQSPAQMEDEQQSVSAPAVPEPAPVEANAAAQPSAADASAGEGGPVLDFVKQSRGRLGEIDALLEEEGNIR